MIVVSAFLVTYVDSTHVFIVEDDGFRAADINTEAFLLSPPSSLLTLPSPVAHTLPDCRVSESPLHVLTSVTLRNVNYSCSRYAQLGMPILMYRNGI